MLNVLVSNALGGAFALLAAASLAGWIRHRDGVRGYAALAAIQLAVALLAFEIDDLTGERYRALLVVGAVSTIGSGYALLLLRSRLMPVSRRTMRLVQVSLLSSLVLFAMVDTAEQNAVLFLPAMVTWIGSVTEPVVRFWRESRRHAVVQRARLRALAIGYALLVLIFLAWGVGMSVTGSSESSIELLSLPAMAVVVVVLFAAFAPPAVLRRAWRRREETALLEASPFMLAPDAAQVASGAVEWAVRILGGAGGELVDPQGRVLCSSVTHAGDRVWGQAATVRVPFEAGRGRLTVYPGPFTPTFGRDEHVRLVHHAAATAAALDRAHLDQSRRDFLTVASHELRTPLTVVLGLGRTLQIGAGAMLSDEQRSHCVDRLVANAERMERIVADLLDLDRLSRGIVEPCLERHDAGELVSEIVTKSAATAQRRIHVFAPCAPAMLDRVMVGHVIENLLQNALKHTPDTATVCVRVERTAHEIVVVVEDDGPGIPDSIRESIFEPFRRGPDAPSHSPGHGIGLALVAKFAEAHGGRAWAAERYGGGASFHVTFNAPWPRDLRVAV